MQFLWYMQTTVVYERLLKFVYFMINSSINLEKVCYIGYTYFIVFILNTASI